MHVSVTTLGATAGDLGRAAGQIVGYLEGNQPGRSVRRDQPGSRGPDTSPIANALEQGGPRGYYADAAEAPGRWRGKGAAPEVYDLGTVVQAEQFRRVLLGQNPETGGQLVERTSRQQSTSKAPGGGEPLSCQDAAAILGVSPSYVQRLAKRTAAIRAERVTAAANGSIGPELPASHLDAAKQGGQWVISRGELERFAADRHEPKVVMGYDVTWSVPKSVSMLYAAGDDVLRDRIDTAIESAVSVGMRYLESEGFHVRAGRGRSRAGEMIAASYRHTTNRALEPQLHEHVVIANIATAPDGKVRAVDARGLFAHATPAGYLAAAQLRHDLRQTGLQWGPVHKGLADVAGIDRDQIMAMSSRRQDVLSLSDELGYLTPQARQTAALATRPGKETSVDRDELFDRWQHMLANIGIDPNRVTELTSHDPSVALWSPSDTDALYRHLSSHRGVTEQVAIFDRRDVIEAIATYAVDRLPATVIVDLADHWLTTDAAIELEIGDGARRETIGTGAGQVSLTPDERRYTTPEMLTVEARVADWHQRGIRTGHALVDPGTVETAITRTPHTSGIELDGDQADLVRALTTSGDQFQAAQGLAGAGKTTALTAAIDAWQTDGYTVIGAAPFAEAARTLEAETGVASRTLEALLQRVELAADPRQVLDPTTVIVVDEASTIGNRQLHRLYHAAATTGASVRTIGDPQQHQSVEAGGLWAHLTTRFADRTPVLATNRRQSGPDMADVRLALDDYRNGLVATALERLDDDNRIIVADSWDDLLDQMTADWYLDHQRHRSGHTIPSQMIAERNADRHALNRRAQAWLRHDGTLTDQTRIGDDTFHTGDRVVAQVADKALAADADTRRHVINGSIGTITGRTGDPRHPDLIVDFDHLGTITVPHDFIAAEVGPGRGGGLTPAYAVTSYKAEGQTYDAARGLAAPGAINTEGMYVALTRGRNDLRVYSIAPADQRSEPPELPVIDDPRAATQALADTLSKWRGADIATVADPDAAPTRSLSAASLSQLAEADPHDDSARRARQALETRIAGHAINNPDPAVVAQLGPRPEQGTHRDEWDRAVSQLALYVNRWSSEEPNAGLVPQLTHTTSPPQRAEHAALTDAVQTAELRLAEARPIGELIDEAECIAEHLKPLVATSSPPTHDLHAAAAEARRAAARAVAARARHATIAATPRVNPDTVEAARRSARRAEIERARAQVALEDARTMQRAKTGNPDARMKLQSRHSTLETAIDRKIVTAVRRPAPYLTDALGPRPARGNQDRAPWNAAASHIEAYRHKSLRLEPNDGPLGGTGLHAALGPRPRIPLLAKHWARAAKEAARISPTLEPEQNRAHRIR